ncbi:response regulator transcription factor [Streptomyces polygonati]|uniref:Sensory transduction protein RegX3 n=1 Tax=Streptomyces polygonati TaxID=1617087 RepID=A0ABV8I0E6_9ACTN
MRVLVVEPCTDIAERLVGVARRQGYSVQTASRGQEALTKYQRADLVLLNLALTDIDGLEVCRTIRAAGHTPIICVSAQDSTLNRVLALKSGADDCVVESCAEQEIIARIEAVMRRTGRRDEGLRAISAGSLHIDGRTRQVRLGDQPVDVTCKEFELLYTLAANPETVVSRKELMATVWRDNGVWGSRTIDTHISSLRTKLGSSTWIVTVRGVGYRIGHGTVVPGTPGAVQ